METPDFSAIFKTIKEALAALAKDTIKDFTKEAINDTVSFLNNSKEKLKRWTVMLEQGILTPDEFGWLLESQKDLLVLEALKQKGIAAIRLEEFKNKIIETIMGTVASILKI